MNGPDHYREAERRLEEAESHEEPGVGALWCLGADEGARGPRLRDPCRERATRQSTKTPACTRFEARSRAVTVRYASAGAGAGGRRNGRTGTDGEGRSDARDLCTSRMPTVLRHRLPADLPIQAASSLAPQVVEPTAERASCTHSAASPPPAASISSIICTGTMYSPICSARWRGQGRMVTFL